MLEHHCHSQIQKEVVAYHYAEGEEESRESIIVSITHHVEQVGPTIDCRALEDSEEGCPNVVEVRYSPVKL
jgi:hypothetical protein